MSDSDAISENERNRDKSFAGFLSGVGIGLSVAVSVSLVVDSGVVILLPVAVMLIFASFVLDKRADMMEASPDVE